MPVRPIPPRPATPPPAKSAKTDLNNAAARSATPKPGAPKPAAGGPKPATAATKPATPKAQFTADTFEPSRGAAVARPAVFRTSTPGKEASPRPATPEASGAQLANGGRVVLARAGGGSGSPGSSGSSGTPQPGQPGPGQGQGQGQGSQIGAEVGKEFWNKSGEVFHFPGEAGSGKPGFAEGDAKFFGYSTTGGGRLDPSGVGFNANGEAFLGKAEGKAGLKYRGGETTVQGDAFAGGKLGLDVGAGRLSDGSLGVRSNAEAFAGAEASAGITQRVGPVSVTPNVGVEAGIGANLDAELGYQGGHLRGNFGAGAAFGLGAKGGVSFDVDVAGAAKDLQKLGSGAVDGLERLGSGTVNTLETIGGGARDALGTVGNGAVDTLETIGSGASKAWDKITPW